MTARPSAADGHYALLVFDGLRLLIPQGQLHALEPGFDVHYPQPGGPGRIAAAGSDSPVYCLSQDLRPLTEAPASRKICVLLNLDDGLFGLLCDEVTLLEQILPEVLPLPACMNPRELPLQGLVLQGDQVLCVGSADDLFSCLDDQEGRVKALSKDHGFEEALT